MRSTVYMLVDPATGRPRYVGKTMLPLERRLTRHLRDVREDRPWDRVRWLKTLSAPPRIVPLCTVDGSRDAGDEMERRMIALFRFLGHDLTNMTDGGAGMLGCSPGPETKRKRSRALAGRPKSPEAIARVAEALRGRKLSAAHRQHLSEARKGVKMPPRTPEHAEKIAAQNRGRKATEVARARMSAARLGKKQSAEAVAKTRLAITGLKRTPEQCERIGAAKRGIPQSPEHVAKRAAAVRAYHARRRAQVGGVSW